jgi:hypothetical protein
MLPHCINGAISPIVGKSTFSEKVLGKVFS